MALTDRWTKLKPHPTQLAYRNSTHRFNVVPAGRRSGKTERAKRKLVQCALAGNGTGDARFFGAAPTRDQAKKIWWQDLKAMTPAWALASRPLETDLCLKFVTGSEIWVVGMDRPERIEGSPWDGGVLDEYANMRETAWTQNVRPALSDRNGWCDFIGVPEGRNHYYDLWEQALSDDSGDWGTFHWKSADILSEAEIAAARRDLDELIFRQEYEADFILFAGQAYYNFSPETHLAPLEYDERYPLILCFDFNVEPGVCAVIQEQRMPRKEVERKDWIDGTGVIGEVYIPRNSNTEAVCRKILQDWGDHSGEVYCYGDATGGARKTSATGTDWDIIRRDLRSKFGGRLNMRNQKENPPERVRINAVNARLMSGDKQIRLMVDGKKAPMTAKDFAGVRLLEGGSGEIDKKHDPKLTHLTDGIGYYVAERFPIERRGTAQREFLV